MTRTGVPATKAWQKWEDDAIRKFYPIGGWKMVHGRVDQCRSPSGIIRRASLIRVKVIQKDKPVNEKTFKRNELDDLFAPVPMYEGKARFINAEDLPMSSGLHTKGIASGIQSSFSSFYLYGM